MSENEFEQKIDLKNSILPLEGTKKDQAEWGKRIDNRLEALKKDQSKRRKLYQKRHDFFIGDQSSYTTIIGRVAKEKKGHANAVFNYAGKTGVKIAYGLANNPPKINIPARSIATKFMPQERARAQGVEDFMEEVFKITRFYKKAYRRTCFNQVNMGDGAVKIYPIKKDGSWEIRIIAHEKMDNLLVGWRGDEPSEFDYVIAEVKTSIQALEEQYGIKVPLELAMSKTGGSNEGNAWEAGNNWGSTGGAAKMDLASGDTDSPSVILKEYDDENVYALKIGNKLVSLTFKDGKDFPKMKFWILVPNIPNPGSPWSMSDLDYLIDPQVEFNEASNEERDYIRVGANQKYVAYNMSEFDPESIKTGSGGVIFVDSPDGNSRFEPLAVNVNVFPIDQYLNRIQGVIYDLGIPKVTYGVSGDSSGRSKAIDFQSYVDLIIYKRDSWELAFDEIIEKIQILGNFYFKNDYFLDPETGGFVVRRAEFDWTDILPVTQADKVVNVINKVQMGLPFRLAYQELGYKNVEAIIAEMKEEARDPDLMLIRSKMYQLTPGVIQAQQNAQSEMAANQPAPTPGMPPATGAPGTNTPSPTLTSQQNSGRESSLPMAQAGGTTTFSSPKGFIDQVKQNLTARGR